MSFNRTVQVLSFKLTVVETFILGAVLAALAAVQQQISMSAQAHAAVAMAIVLIGGLAHPLTSTQFLAKIPVQVIGLVNAGLGAVLILNQSFDIGNGGRTAVAVVIVIATTWGFGPSPIPAPLAAAKSRHQ